jgi:hypothetical protein
MSQDKKPKRLTINKETITDLEVRESEAIKGGTVNSRPPACPDPTKPGAGGPIKASYTRICGDK